MSKFFALTLTVAFAAGYLCRYVAVPAVPAIVPPTSDAALSANKRDDKLRMEVIRQCEARGGVLVFFDGNVDCDAAEEGIAENHLFVELDNREFVRLMYRSLLGREGEPEGLQGKVDWLERGATRAWVAWHMIDSEEFRRKTAGGTR